MTSRVINPTNCYFETAVDLDDLINIQYTSGTTGFPKGCMLSHRYWLLLAKVQGEHDGRTYHTRNGGQPVLLHDAAVAAV